MMPAGTALFPLNRSLFMSPLLLPPSAWLGHIPFAAWLMEMQKPDLFVELGTHAGASFFSFCQAVVENNLSTQCVAVDTWEGDEHAGYYGEEMFRDVSDYHRTHYVSFSRLLRMTFDRALPEIADRSVDLLHIDGLHTYDAVKHDFDTWLPKMSERGIVLLHDTQVRERGFGVWQLWREISERYPHFEFSHSYGLGVLFVGRDVHPTLLEFASLSMDDRARELTRGLFARLGSVLEQEHRLRSCEDRLVSLQTERDDGLAALRRAERQIEQLKESTSWKITSPLRVIAEHFRRFGG